MRGAPSYFPTAARSRARRADRGQADEETTRRLVAGRPVRRCPALGEAVVHFCIRILTLKGSSASHRETGTRHGPRGPQRSNPAPVIGGRVGTSIGWWSCGESNPGPRAPSQVFSGCSPCWRFLGPGARTNTSPTGPVRFESRSAALTATGQQVSWMTPGSGTETDARSDASITASGGESEGTALSVGSYWFPAIVYEMTLASRPASPGTNVPSRNRSAPLELYLSNTTGTPRHSPPGFGGPLRRPGWSILSSRRRSRRSRRHGASSPEIVCPSSRTALRQHTSRSQSSPSPRSASQPSWSA